MLGPLQRLDAACQVVEFDGFAAELEECTCSRHPCTGLHTPIRLDLGKPKRVSALDAAATILTDTGKPMRATELIAEMEQRGLWKSPGGRTPESTLYAALSREIAFKGDASRFARGEKGFFIARTRS